MILHLIQSDTETKFEQVVKPVVKNEVHHLHKGFSKLLNIIS